MSIRLMAEVWELELDHPRQAILLALADHADDEGGRVFPSLAFVGWKTGYSERQVRRIVRELEAAGLLVLARESTRYRPNEYRIDLSAGTKKAPFVRPDRMTALEDPAGRTNSAPGRTNQDTRPDTTMTAEPPREPSVEPPRDLKAATPPEDQHQEQGPDTLDTTEGTLDGFLLGAISDSLGSPVAAINEGPTDEELLGRLSPAPAPSDQQVYLVGRLHDASEKWHDLTYGAIVKLNKAHGRPTTTEALGRAWEETASGTLAPTRPYALVNEIAATINRERTPADA